MTEKKPTFLFLTSPEAGQANCQLAVIASIKEKHGENADIHFCSCESLRKKSPPNVTFHSISGTGIHDGLMKRFGPSEKGLLSFVFDHAGFLGSINSVRKLPIILHPEPLFEYVPRAQEIEQIIEKVQPDYIIVDAIFDTARDAIAAKGRIKDTTVLLPNTSKEAALAEQGLAMFGIPAVCTGYPYPLPWYRYPANIAINLFAAFFIFAFNSAFRALNKTRNASGYKGVLPVFGGYPENSVLCMSTIGAEIPLKIPTWLHCCGPILQAAKPFQQVDPELYEWCQARPTILICLGSNFKYWEEYANEMLKAIRVILAVRTDIQVLWKFATLTDFKLKGLEEAGDRLKVIDWLKADPIAILKEGNIICSVSHGGSNSYHEALQAAIPQVLMPAWADCYDFTARVEYLGIGTWGNKTANPQCSEPEFTEAVLKVIGRTPDSLEALKMRERAQDLGKLVTKNYTQEGRDVAADHIWEEMEKARARK